MTREDILAYARRDWAAVEAAKAADWAERKATMSAGDLLALSDLLRRNVLALRPDWPSAAEREADLAAHVELSKRLRRVRYVPPR